MTSVVAFAVVVRNKRHGIVGVDKVRVLLNEFCQIL